MSSNQPELEALISSISGSWKNPEDKRVSGLVINYFYGSGRRFRDEDSRDEYILRRHKKYESFSHKVSLMPPEVTEEPVLVAQASSQHSRGVQTQDLRYRGETQELSVEMLNFPVDLEEMKMQRDVPLFSEATFRIPHPETRVRRTLPSYRCAESVRSGIDPLVLPTQEPALQEVVVTFPNVEFPFQSSPAAPPTYSQPTTTYSPPQQAVPAPAPPVSLPPTEDRTMTRRETLMTLLGVTLASYVVTSPHFGIFEKVASWFKGKQEEPSPPLGEPGADSILIPRNELMPLYNMEPDDLAKAIDRINEKYAPGRPEIKSGKDLASIVRIAMFEELGGRYKELKGKSLDDPDETFYKGFLGIFNVMFNRLKFVHGDFLMPKTLMAKPAYANFKFGVDLSGIYRFRESDMDSEWFEEEQSPKGFERLKVSEWKCMKAEAYKHLFLGNDNFDTFDGGHDFHPLYVQLAKKAFIDAYLGVNRWDRNNPGKEKVRIGEFEDPTYGSLFYKNDRTSSEHWEGEVFGWPYRTYTNYRHDGEPVKLGHHNFYSIGVKACCKCGTLTKGEQATIDEITPEQRRMMEIIDVSGPEGLTEMLVHRKDVYLK